VRYGFDIVRMARREGERNIHGKRRPAPARLAGKPIGRKQRLFF